MRLRASTSTTRQMRSSAGPRLSPKPGRPESRAQSPICVGRGQAGATMVRRLASGGLLGVVHDVSLHGFVIGGYTRDGDAEPGSRCKSDTVLVTVARELAPQGRHWAHLPGRAG